MPTAECHAVQNLLAVIGDIDGFDLGGASRSKLLRELARTILQRTGVTAIEIVIVDTPDDGMVRATECEDATLICEPAERIELVARNDGWWAGKLDRPPVGEFSLFDQFETTNDHPSELVLSQRIRLRSCYGLIRVTGPAEKMGDPGLWSTGLTALFQTLSTRRHEARRAQRQDFYNSLVGVSAANPETTFDLVCKEWHKLGQADNTWLWLRNQYTNRFEWAANQGQMPTLEDGLSPDHFEPGNHSASEYAIKTMEALYIRGDLTEWCKEFDGVEHRVENAARVKDRFGCQTLIIVPFKYPESGSPNPAPYSPTIVGTVALHYRDPHTTPYQRKDSLQLMGRYTAQAVVTTFRDQQRRLLVELNAMAQQHLTRVSRRPAQVRTEYLKQLIDLIRQSLGFRVVSIFYRRPFAEEIACVASTGIALREGPRIPDERLTDVVYQKGQGRTGGCLATGQVRVFDRKTDIQPRTPYSIDLDPDTGVEVKGTVFVPIPRREPQGLGPTVLGVIRCGKYDRGVPTNGQGTTIHPIQLQSLEFIAQQVGPMLQILENNIRRERTISTVKHDLYTQMNMIRDAVDRITDDLGEGRTAREYDLKNLGVACLRGSNLIGQLDAEPESQGEYDPKPTMIEGGILARVVNLLRHYAWSEREMAIEYDVRAIPKLLIDPAMIERAIHNLIVNAIKYGEPGTTVWVRGRSARGGYMLDVSNEGIGIDDRDAKRIGEPNFRAENTKHLAQGTGLGLYIARMSMRKHGGDLLITKNRNPTTFSLFFPRKLER